MQGKGWRGTAGNGAGAEYTRHRDLCGGHMETQAVPVAEDMVGAE